MDDMRALSYILVIDSKFLEDKDHVLNILAFS